MANSIPGNCIGNTAVGDDAGCNFGGVGDCSNNTAIGHMGIVSLANGGNNSAIGYMAGWNPAAAPSTLNNSTYLGAKAVNSADGVTNETVVGYGATGKGSNTIIFGNSDASGIFFGGTLPTSNPGVTGQIWE